MSVELLAVSFWAIDCAVIFAIVWIESVLSVPQVQWLGYDNILIIAPLVLMTSMVMFMPLQRKYRHQTCGGNRAVALLSAIALGFVMVVPATVIALRTSQSVERFFAVIVVICGSISTYYRARSVIERNR